VGGLLLEFRHPTASKTTNMTPTSGACRRHVSGETSWVGLTFKIESNIDKIVIGALFR
jgi:hypothetical protein